MPLGSSPDQLFDKVLTSFNDLFSKPNFMPKVQTNAVLDVGKVTVSLQAVGVLVEGDDFQRVGNSSTYSAGGSSFYKTQVGVGGIRFTYNDVSVQVKGKTYKASVIIPSYRTPVPFLLEKSPSTKACGISVGPFDSDLSHTTLNLKETVEDEETKEILKQVQQSNTFISNFFLDAFFAAAEDPLFLLIKQENICECLVGLKNKC